MELYHTAGICPNLRIALRLLLTIGIREEYIDKSILLLVLVSSYEKSFSKLMLFKNYLCPSMRQERLYGLALLSIERKRGRKVKL